MKLSSIFNFFALLSLTTLMACSEDEFNPQDATGDVVITVSKSLIEADGKDVAVFTVTQGGADVTKWATIYQKTNDKWSIYKGTEFSSDTEGNFEFSASHNGKDSETILIQAATGLSELPEDSKPEQFDGFKKRVLAMQFTGIGCGYCPYVINAIENFLPMENSKDMVFTALHTFNTADPMFSDDAWEVGNNMNITSWPTMVYNLNEASDASDTTPESLSGIVDKYMGSPANSNISASITLDGSETEGSVKVQGAIKIGHDGQYGVAVWLLEDSIKAPQSNYTNIQVGNIHNNSVRLCNTTSPAGNQFGGRNDWKKGNVGVFYHEFDLKKANIQNLKNCHVVVYVTSNVENNFFTVDNVIDCKIGEIRSFEYEK